MREISYNNGVEEIVVKDENGEILTVLLIDTADISIKSRYAKLLDDLTGVSDRAEAEINELNDRYKDIPEDELNTQRIIDRSRCEIKYINEIIAGLDDIFGAGTIHNVFAKHYELNEDFVPDEYLIMDFLSVVTPIMEELFKTRYEVNDKKYNVNRKAGKGKHNRSKEELIKQAMGRANE